MSRRPHLTFDDGPAADTAPLLDVLARHRERATFFLVGQRVEQHPELVQRTADEGHVIGNHSWDHPNLRQLSLEAVRTQLTRTSDAIERAAGTRPRLFRPPYGYSSPAIAELASSLGMLTILWDVNTRDWENPGVETIAQAISSAPPGATVLLHDGRASDELADRQQTVAAVELALAGAR